MREEEESCHDNGHSIHTARIDDGQCILSALQDHRTKQPCCTCKSQGVVLASFQTHVWGWTYEPGTRATPLINEADVNDADDDEDEEKGMSQSEMGELLQEVNSSEDEKAVASDISNLFSAGDISAKEKDSLIL